MWKDFSCLESPIVEYIRDRQNRKKGVLVAGVLGSDVVVGWSLCSNLDTFDKEEGFFIAEGRACSNDRLAARFSVNGGDIVPQSLVYPITDFVARIKRYYKTTPFSDFAKRFDI